jgi:Phosphotransferase enzyme family
MCLRITHGQSGATAAMLVSVARPGDMNADEAIALLSATTAEGYELVGRLTGGETGAHEVVGPGHRRLVVKWDDEPSSVSLRREAVALSERLRTEVDWPLPRQRTVVTGDWLFVIQDFMPGSPVEAVGHGIVDRLLDLHARRLGLARPSDPRRWPDHLIATLTVGGHSYCRHASLRHYDARTASIISRIEAFGHAIGGQDLAGHDIVHWDWHPGNLLQDGGNLTAIVDSDFAQVGDAAFDVVMLALTSLTLPCDAGVRRRLFTAAFADLDDVRRRAYVGHLFIRFLDWPIRRHNVEEIDFWVAQADRLLDF